MSKADLFSENYKLPERIFHQSFSRYTHVKEDLLQEGRVALFNCVEKFDESFGWKFSTYAWKAIEGKMRNYIRDHGNTIRLPRKDKVLYVSILELKQQDVPESEILEKLGITREEYTHTMLHCEVHSLDAHVEGDEDKPTLQYYAVGPTKIVEAELIHLKDTMREFELNMSKTNPRGLSILKDRALGLSCEEMGRNRGCTVTDIRREIQTARRQARRALQNKMVEEYI